MVNYNFDSCLYWTKVWYFILREERRLRVTENSALREKVTEMFGQLYNEVFNILVSLRNVVRLNTSRNIIRMGHVTCIGKMIKVSYVNITTFSWKV
jgi:hypothetical protein